MAIRVWAAALALVLTGGPVLTTTCQAMCAAREGAPSMAGEQHACHHHDAPSPNGLAMTAAPHSCGHSDDSPTAIDQALQSLPLPGLIVAAFSLTPPAVATSRVRTAHRGHSPPDSLNLNTQLRV